MEFHCSKKCRPIGFEGGQLFFIPGHFTISEHVFILLYTYWKRIPHNHLQLSIYYLSSQFHNNIAKT